MDKFEEVDIRDLRDEDLNDVVGGGDDIVVRPTTNEPI